MVLWAAEQAAHNNLPRAFLRRKDLVNQHSKGRIQAGAVIHQSFEKSIFRQHNNIEKYDSMIYNYIEKLE